MAIDPLLQPNESLLNRNIAGSARAREGGSLAAPAFNKYGEDTGMYFPSSNNLGLVTNSVEALRINSFGYVGIGTTDPQQKLSVNRSLGIAGTTSPYYTIFQGGAQSQNITYTLPTSTAAGAGFVLSNTSGTLSWVSPGAASLAMGSSITGGALAGSVLFIDSGTALAQDNDYFHYEESTHRLGLGTTDPLYTLDITGTFRVSSTDSLRSDEWL